MASLDAPPIDEIQKAEDARRLAAALMQPVPLAQTGGRMEMPWMPDQIAPPPQHLTSMANNPIAHGIGEAVLSPITEAGEYVGGLMQGTIPFQPGEAVKEGLKLGSAFIGPKIGGGSAAAGAAKLAPILSIFAGPAAKTADRAALDLAEKMAQRGLSPQTIWDKTGWFAGADGKWRFEIPDNQLAVAAGQGRGISGPASQIQHSALAEAYPELGGISHDISTTSRKSNEGSFSPPINYLNVAARSPTDARGVLAHELQHPIQGIEGFAPGGSPEEMQSFVEQAMREHGLTPGNDHPTREVMFQAYRNLAGEVEARNVQRRLHMTPEMRREIPPWTTEDVPRDQQIVRGVQDMLSPANLGQFLVPR